MHASQQHQPPIIIDIMRHGEPEGGTLYRGSKDDPLSELGWQQMEQTLATAIDSGYQWDQIISSPLKRCRAFAEKASQQLDIPLEITTDLRELNFGDLEGMRPKDAWDKYPELLKNMWIDPEAHTAPNGEPFGAFSKRVKSALESIFTSHSGKHVLVVAHGGVVRAAIHGLLGVKAAATFKFEVPYASLTRFQVYPNNDNGYEASLSYLNGLRPTVTP